MNTQSVCEKLEQLVDECVEQNMMFTVYDLTMKLRAEGEFLKHHDSRLIVHGMYDDDLIGDYTRTLVNLGGAEGPCFVYHAPHHDPYRYQNQLGQMAQPVNVSPSSQWHISASIVRQISRDPNQRPLTSRRRLSIPASQVRSAGLDVGDTVYVCYDAISGTFTYESQLPTQGAYDRVYQSTVDAHANIRHGVAQPQATLYCVQRNPLGNLQAVPQVP